MGEDEEDLRQRAVDGGFFMVFPRRQSSRLWARLFASPPTVGSYCPAITTLRDVPGDRAHNVLVL